MSVLGLAAVVTVVAVLVLAAVLIAYLMAPGPARAGLASLGVAAALVGPVVGIGTASWLLIHSFSGMAVTGSGGTAVVLGACAEAATLIRIGCGAAALILVASALLGWIGRGDPPALPAASLRRLVVLALPAFLAPLLVAGSLEYSRRMRNLIIEVVTATEPATPVAASEAGAETHAIEEAPRVRPSAGIAEISQRLAVGLMSGFIGVPLFVLVLSGFGGGSAILAWRTRVPNAFAAALSVWMLLQALLWIGAMFVFRTPTPAG